MMTKKERRKTRIAGTRKRQLRLGATRVVVCLTEKHTYAQIISPEAKVLVSASTAEKEMKTALGGKNGANIAAARQVGSRLAEKSRDLQFGQLGFDRGGRRYTGRVRALAEAAREGGLAF